MRLTLKLLTNVTVNIILALVVCLADGVSSSTHRAHRSVQKCVEIAINLCQQQDRIVSCSFSTSFGTTSDDGSCKICICQKCDIHANRCVKLTSTATVSIVHIGLIAIDICQQRNTCCHLLNLTIRTSPTVNNITVPASKLCLCGYKKSMDCCRICDVLQCQDDSECYDYKCELGTNGDSIIIEITETQHIGSGDISDSCSNFTRNFECQIEVPAKSDEPTRCDETNCKRFFCPDKTLRPTSATETSDSSSEEPVSASTAPDSDTEEPVSASTASDSASEETVSTSTALESATEETVSASTVPDSTSETLASTSIKSSSGNMSSESTFSSTSMSTLPPPSPTSTSNSSLLVPTTSHIASYPVSVVVGSVFGIIVAFLIAVVLLVIIYRRYKRKENLPTETLLNVYQIDPNVNQQTSPSVYSLAQRVSASDDSTQPQAMNIYSTSPSQMPSNNDYETIAVDNELYGCESNKNSSYSAVQFVDEYDARGKNSQQEPQSVYSLVQPVSTSNHSTEPQTMNILHPTSASQKPSNDNNETVLVDNELYGCS